MQHKKISIINHESYSITACVCALIYLILGYGTLKSLSQSTKILNLIIQHPFLLFFSVLGILVGLITLYASLTFISKIHIYTENNQLVIREQYLFGFLPWPWNKNSELFKHYSFDKINNGEIRFNSRKHTVRGYILFYIQSLDDKTSKWIDDELIFQDYRTPKKLINQINEKILPQYNMSINLHMSKTLSKALNY